MGLGQWLACNVTPLLLRLGLAAVFLWAGYGKLMYNDPVSGEDAAILANMGVIKMATALPAPKEPPTETPANDVPPDVVPTVPSEAEKPAAPESPEQRSQSSMLNLGRFHHGIRSGPGAPGLIPSVRSNRSESVCFRSDIEQPEFALVRARADESTPAKAQTAPATMSPAPAAFTAEDFPTPVMIPRLYQIALVLHKASHPADPAKQLWPTPLSESGTIRMFAWLAAITEVAGGALVLFGFLTRVAALGLASTMCVAILLTTIGPAAISGEGFLGFLPQPKMSHAEGSGTAWITMMFQWAMLMMSLGLMFAGPGGLSLDRLIFGRQKPRANATVKST